MSILFSRLLGSARELLAEGDTQQAETLCCQVINGAVAVRNAALATEAARLLVAIPDTQNPERRSAVLALYYEVIRIQAQPEIEPVLAMVDVLLDLLENDPVLYKDMLEAGTFICANAGIDRLKYLRPLLRFVSAPHGVPAGAGVECSPEQGPAAAAAVLAARGGVLLRGLFDTILLDRLRRAIENYFDETGQGTVSFSKMTACREPLTERTLPFLQKLLTPFLGDRPELIPELSYARQVAAYQPETTVPFHQDFNVFGRVVVNVWAPLVPCGRMAPGLELLAERVDHIAETMPARDQYNGLEIPEELIKERFGEDRVIAPEMMPGDALVLLATTIHRTYHRPEMTERRLSLELRFG